MAEKIVIAHRGASAYAHENSLEAFEIAIEQGAQMVEFDVRKTVDKVLVLYHDEDYLGDEINTLTLWKFKEIFRGQTATLEEALKLCQGRVRMNVEIKESGYEEEILEMVLKYASVNDFVMTSFNAPSLLKIKKLNENVRIGYVLGRVKSFLQGWLSDLLTANRKAIELADFIIVNHSRVEKGLTRNSFYKNKKILVWTVNEQERAKKLLEEKNVYGIITDNPDKILSLIKRYEQ